MQILWAKLGPRRLPRANMINPDRDFFENDDFPLCFSLFLVCQSGGIWLALGLILGVLGVILEIMGALLGALGGLLASTSQSLEL